ncbi:hypothetical protein [Zoogloea sp.]|uniref:hypothetical protein n=1 Tax=Zoogloea sp. TaxID=49181 RepID=UPI0014157F5D|nr:MAG: hypothetical protein F9K15_07560 [Zoogloea sp.]
MPETPSWLKRSENGSIGEARARAFLLERFWLLERSVDKDGADYLIQRRLTTDNFLSRDPPRLGVVQVKFLQDEGTTIYLAPEYVCDKDNRPYSEFFLLVHTGSEDSQRQFLLTAKQITEDFKKSVLKGGEEKYYIPGAKLLRESTYEILNKRRALDKIEHALNNANFLRNRSYFGGSQYVKIEKHHIDNDYLVPIDNGYCDFDKEFFEQKKKLQSALFDLEEVTEAIGKILRSTDPIEAFELYEESIEQYIGSGGWRSCLSFKSDFFEDEDFISAARNHRARLNKIREFGLEHDYLNLLDEYEQKTVSWIINNEAWKTNDFLKVSINYDAKTLKNATVRFQSVESDATKFDKVISSVLGKQTIIFKPASLKRAWDAPHDSDTSSIVRSNSWIIRRTFQKELDKHLLGEDFVSPWM